jgi:glutamate dehydrogenase
MNYFWERDDVLGRLDNKMTSAYHSISEVARKQKIYMRDAAYVVAINRVAAACRDRGWV